MIAASALLLAGCAGSGGTGAETTTSPPTSATTTTSTSTTSPTSTSSTGSPATSATTPTEAIEAWLGSQGYVYAGDCAGATIGPVQKWCSTLSEDRGAEQVYKVGRVSSQYEYSLLLRKSGTTWKVLDTSTITLGP